MSVRLKQLAISALLRSLQTVLRIIRNFWSLLVFLITPLFIIIKFIFRPGILLLYRWYLKLLNSIKRSAFLRNKVFFIFGNKYLIHVIIIIIALFVGSTNILQAKEVGQTTFGTQSGLYEIVNPEGSEFSEDIVEEGLIQSDKSNKSYINTAGVELANIANIDPLDKPLQTVGQELAQVNQKSGGAAVVSNNVLETETGNRSDFISYTVKDGDTISTIAERFKISSRTIVWANNLNDNSYIRPGDTLSVPPISGYAVTVTDGDTLQKLVDKHKGNFAETVKLAGGETIPVGQKIMIVDGEPYVPPPPPTPIATTTPTRASGGSGATGSNSNLYQKKNVPGSVTGGNLNWPVGCRSNPTTYWGHGARDIACSPGTPIYAAESGTARVACSGSYCGGYGNYITIEHGGGLSTLYAHMSAFNISGTQRVNRGDVIGFVGSTGRSTGPHLHFEVRVNGAKQEPLNYIR